MSDIESLLTDTQLKVYDVFKLRGWNGATCDEVEAVTGLTHQSASARVHELANFKPKPLIERRAAKRKTRAGRSAMIYVIAGAKDAAKRSGADPAE